ncbi:MAG TPA: hypothetical protein P5080_04600 [Candidatus Paceibacterota bacterium]|nr:hypothetical protein [Candidatus Pacearchaeota archaeon]HRZ51230.1 hypothetical protein [Candidatus Paceibacterota bacterium]HSA36952.1 hypothetical protein [Candidatus Paceibacterota bacterium]
MSVLIQLEDGSILNYKTTRRVVYCVECGQEGCTASGIDREEDVKYVTPCGLENKRSDWPGCAHLDCAIKLAPNTEASCVEAQLGYLIGILVFLFGFFVHPMLGFLGIIIFLLSYRSEKSQNEIASKTALQLLEEFKRSQTIYGRPAKKISSYPRQ